MALAAITGIPMVAVGAAQLQGSPAIGALATSFIDAVNEAVIQAGHLYWTDGGSHTIDTTGSSSIQWRSGNLTFASASTTIIVGIAPVDTATGPPVRASNTANVINYDVSVPFTGGGGGITANAWQTSVPTSGTKTIASGDLIAICIQMTARGGADTLDIQMKSENVLGKLPAVTDYTSASYSDKTYLPNVVVVASDGTLGFIYGSYVALTGSTTQTWNNTSGTKEYGNILRFPFPVRAYGIVVACSVAGNCDFVLYSDPLGTPVAQKTISVDLNTVANSTVASDGRFPFSSSYDLEANTDYAVIAKPSSATNVGMPYKSYNAASHQNSEPLGTSCYAINRNAGAFAAQNSSKDRFAIGLLIGAFDAGGGAGSIDCSPVIASISDTRVMIGY